MNALPALTPDGQYRVDKSGDQVAIFDNSTGDKLFQSKPQFDTLNPAKAWAVSRDGKYLAVWFHYGHKGAYTYIAIYEIPSGGFVRSIEVEGNVYKVPKRTFKEY